MDIRDSDPPSSENDPPVDGPPSAKRVAAARPVAEAPASPAESPATAALRAAVRAYVSRPETLAGMRKKVARKVPPDDVDDVVQVAVTKALTARRLPASEDRIPGWARTMVRRAIARYHRQKNAREEREALTDVADQYVDPSTDVGWDVHGWMIRPWLEKQVAGNDRDEEIFDILMEKANTGMTYEALATKYGMTLAALTSRLFQFKGKYGTRYKRYKREAILFLLGGVVAIALALVLWLLRGRLFHAEPPPPPSTMQPAPAVVPPAHDPSKDVSHPRPPQ